MKIKITSQCLAMLLYKASNATGQSEGCLCGEFSVETKTEITDSNVCTSTEEIVCKSLLTMSLIIIRTNNSAFGILTKLAIFLPLTCSMVYQGYFLLP